MKLLTADLKTGGESQMTHFMGPRKQKKAAEESGSMEVEARGTPSMEVLQVGEGASC